MRVPASAKRGKKVAKNTSRSVRAGTRRATFKFRVEAERAAIVQRIAKAEGKSESEVLREGIDLLERSRARREHAPRLADFIKEIPPQYRRR